MYRVFVGVLSLGLLSSGYATWQVASSDVTVMNPALSAFALNNAACPLRYQDQKYAVIVSPGMLEEIVGHIARHCHWRVKWEAPMGYVVLNPSRISGETFPQMMEKLLSHYPVQVSYDEAHREMSVETVLGS